MVGALMKLLGRLVIGDSGSCRLLGWLPTVVSDDVARP